jgi:transposase-like protein
MSQKEQQNEPQSEQPAAGPAGPQEPDIKRWTIKRRSALVLEILRGETTAAEAARKHGLTVAEVEDWKERFLSGAENALRSKPLDEEAQKDHEIRRLKQKVGELVHARVNAVMDMDIPREGVHASVNPAKPYLPNPSGRQTSDE